MGSEEREMSETRTSTMVVASAETALSRESVVCMIASEVTPSRIARSTQGYGEIDERGRERGWGR